MATAPCDSWAVLADACPPCDEYGFDAALLAEAIDTASELLWEASGRVFGVCETSVRPCPHCGCGRSWGRLVRRGSGSCSGCGRGFDTVGLGAYPVREVSEVRIDGAVLDPAAYRVDGHRWLRRLADPDGTRQGWPTGQNLGLADTEAGTWSVTYTHGRDVPAAGRQAAAALACQIALSCQGSDACVLPQGFSTISRQGVTVMAPTDVQVIRRVHDVALFLDSLPSKGARPAVVMSPDTGDRVIVAGTS